MSAEAENESVSANGEKMAVSQRNGGESVSVSIRKYSSAVIS
jgi:hypothetical protein